MLALMLGTLLIFAGCCALLYLAASTSGKPLPGGCGGAAGSLRCEDCPNHHEGRCERQGARP